MSNRRLPRQPGTEISTCSDSLLHAGTCCAETCMNRATLAVLDRGMVEHARCGEHGGDDRSLTKPLLWDPTWEPPGRHDHRLARTRDGEAMEAVITVQPSGVVVMTEEAVLELLADAGWELVP